MRSTVMDTDLMQLMWKGTIMPQTGTRTASWSRSTRMRHVSTPGGYLCGLGAVGGRRTTAGEGRLQQCARHDTTAATHPVYASMGMSTSSSLSLSLEWPSFASLASASSFCRNRSRSCFCCCFCASSCDMAPPFFASSARSRRDRKR